MNIKQLPDGGSMILKKEHDVMLHKCCGCGLWHEVYVHGRNSDLKFTFIRIDGEPKTEDYETIDNEVVEPA